MFTWICPKCGHEVPPSYSECPNCAAAYEEASEEQSADETAAEEEAEERPAPAPPAAPPPKVRRGRVSVPGWMLSLFLALVFAVVGVSVLRMREAQREAEAARARRPAPPMENVDTAAASSDPALSGLELAGLRLSEDAKQHAYVQLVAVNHTGADLGEIEAKVDLKAVTSKDQTPVGTFEFKTSLGPYESKELKVPLQTKLRVYELPDWQFLRARIVGKQDAETPTDRR